MAQTASGIPLVRPLSTPHGADYMGALPEPTEALCGPLGIAYAVGFPPSYIVYRGVWTTDRATGQGKGTWSFHYFGPNA